MMECRQRQVLAPRLSNPDWSSSSFCKSFALGTHGRRHRSFSLVVPSSRTTFGRHQQPNVRLKQEYAVVKITSLQTLTWTESIYGCILRYFEVHCTILCRALLAELLVQRCRDYPASPESNQFTISSLKKLVVLSTVVGFLFVVCSCRFALGKARQGTLPSLTSIFFSFFFYVRVLALPFCRVLGLQGSRRRGPRKRLRPRPVRRHVLAERRRRALGQGAGPTDRVHAVLLGAVRALPARGAGGRGRGIRLHWQCGLSLVTTHRVRGSGRVPVTAARHRRVRLGTPRVRRDAGGGAPRGAPIRPRGCRHERARVVEAVLPCVGAAARRRTRP